MPSIRANAGLYIWLALGVLLLPLSWLIAAAAAAAFHELCHFIAAKWRNVSCSGITLDTGGMILHMGNMTQKDAVLVASAGPAGSLLLGCLLHIWPQIAVCGIVQGLYNLLPIYPLDGGRILRGFMGDKARWVEVACLIFIFLFGVILAFRTSMGIFAIFLSLAVCIRAILRKFPCKEAAIGVQ